MSKSSLVTLPFVLLLLDYWPLARIGPGNSSWAVVRRLIWEKIPLFALSALSCGLTLWAQQDAVAIAASLPFSWRLENTAISYFTYVKQTVFPFRLAVFYPFPKSGWVLWQYGGGVFLGAAVFALLIWKHGARWLTVGALWYLGMLVPMIGLVQVGAQAHADRYTYLPQIGLCIILVWGFAELASVRRWAPRIQACVGTVVVLGLAILSFFQVSHWRDSETLWRRDVAVTSANAVAEARLGGVLLEKGLGGEAIRHYEAAIEIWPNDAFAHTGLGIALFQQGRVKDAIYHYEKVLESDPDNAEAHTNMGVALLQRGRTKEAVLHYERAMALVPDAHQPCNNLAWILATSPEDSLRDGPRAVALAQRALLLLGREDAGTLDTLAAAFAEAGRFDEAEATARRALDLASAANNKALVESLKVELACYRGGKPWRETLAPSAGSL